jgi:hypothetical protein
MAACDLQETLMLGCRKDVTTMSNAGYPDEPTYPNIQPPVPQGNQAMYQPYYRNRNVYPPAGNQPSPAEQGYQPADNFVRSSDFGGAHAESRYSSFVDGQGNIIERRQQVYHDTNQERANIRYWATAIVYFLLGLLEVVLGLRWLFRLLGANPDNNFINFLYSVSHPFVAPFNGIFNDQALGHQGGVFEFSTLIAMLVYALIAWGIVALLNLFLRPVPPSIDTTMTTRRRQY